MCSPADRCLALSRLSRKQQWSIVVTADNRYWHPGLSGAGQPLSDLTPNDGVAWVLKSLLNILLLMEGLGMEPEREAGWLGCRLGLKRGLFSICRLALCCITARLVPRAPGSSSMRLGPLVLPL